MMAALIAGERDPKTLAQLARSRMRTKITALQEAFTGHFTDHHAFLLARMLGRVDAINADIAAIEDRIGEHLVPFASAVDRLDEVPGVGPTAAAVIIAEIGVDMSHFPTRRAPGVLGALRARGAGIRRQTQGPRFHRARQPLPRACPGGGCRRRGQDRHLPR
jgi:transposase